MGRLHRFLRLPAEDRRLLWRAFLSLMWWRMGLWVFPVRTLRRGWRIGARSFHRPLRAERIGWAVQRAAGFVPRATCLPQALAAQSLLARSGHRSRLHIGVAKDGGGRLRAHAWVQYRDRIVTGGGQLDRYTPLFAWEE
jgi:hypothetical protein